MATHKVLLDTRRQLKDGTYPLVVRIYNGRKFRDLSLKTYLKESQFDQEAQKVNGKHPNKKLINQKIKQTVLSVQQTTLKLELQDGIITADKIKTTVQRPNTKRNFIEYATDVIAEMRSVKREGNAAAYEDAINALKNYSGKSDLQFTDVNFELLTSIEHKMLSAGLKRNSIAAYNRALRAVYNRAIKEDLVEVKFYPYRHYKIKGEATAKRNIAKEVIYKIAAKEVPPNSRLWDAQNFFLLSFNLIGMNFADMACIQKTDIKDGRLIYRRKKTHKLYNIKLSDQAQAIIAKYQSEDRNNVLPIIPDNLTDNPQILRKRIKQEAKTCNSYLKDIAEMLELDVKLTTYYARHSWATIAKKMGYSKDMISEALGHSNGNRITEIYLDSFDQEVIDDMNEQVCKLY